LRQIEYFSGGRRGEHAEGLGAVFVDSLGRPEQLGVALELAERFH